MKKSLVIILICLLLIIPLGIIHNSKAQTDSQLGLLEKFTDSDDDGIPDQLDENNLKNLSNNTIGTFQNTLKLIKTKILSIPIISNIDSLLRRIDLVFLVLFGQSYDFTLAFLFIFILWIIILLKSSATLNEIGLSKTYAYLGGIAIAIFFGQIGFLRFIVTISIYLIYNPKSLLASIIYLGIILLLIGLVYVLWTVINKKLEEKRKKKKEKDTEKKQDETQEFIEGLKKGIEGK